jgi:hypothetical protein
MYIDHHLRREAYHAARGQARWLAPPNRTFLEPATGHFDRALTSCKSKVGNRRKATQGTLIVCRLRASEGQG